MGRRATVESAKPLAGKMNDAVLNGEEQQDAIFESQIKALL
jgi:hypothetical protein